MTNTGSHTWRMRQEIEVCPDCIFVSANGEPDYEGYVESGHAARYAQGLKQWGDEPNTIDDSDPSFSKHACDFCGDKLAGNRFTASLMELHTE